MPTLTISIGSLLLLALGGCSLISMDAHAPTTKMPLEGGCEAMRPHFPMPYHGRTDAPDDIARIRNANAAFVKACP